MAIQCFTFPSSLHFPVEQDIHISVIKVNEISVHEKTHLLNRKIILRHNKWLQSSGSRTELVLTRSVILLQIL